MFTVGSDVGANAILVVADVLANRECVQTQGTFNMAVAISECGRYIMALGF